jgi:glutamyl-tRNA synthetase
MKVKTRFAPSPTGKLHIGNARTALINYLYAMHNGGEFILRIDDTDLVRSKQEFEEAIKNDLKWLGFSWGDIFHQSKRISSYEKLKEKLISDGRLYECYETQEELEIKRKLLLSSGRPPIYDRSALKLTDAQKTSYKSAGRTPHYRFKLNSGKIKWQDLIKGEVSFDAENLSDPILIREDGSMTYMLCSSFDDVDMNITHVIRGEDHVSNTAIQIQLFEAISSNHPEFGHLSLVKSKNDKISKRIGGFEIESLRKDANLEPMAINSFLANIGTSSHVAPYKSLDNLTNDFNISKFSKSPTTYLPEELETLNHKLLLQTNFDEVHNRLKEFNLEHISEEFWNAVRPNITTLEDARVWWKVCNNYLKPDVESSDKDYLRLASSLLPEGDLTDATWASWTQTLKNESKRSGKSLFMPLRIAITGMMQGPELNNLLPLIGREEILKRLNLSAS